MFEILKGRSLRKTVSIESGGGNEERKSFDWQRNAIFIQRGRGRWSAVQQG